MFSYKAVAKNMLMLYFCKNMYSYVCTYVHNYYVITYSYIDLLVLEWEYYQQHMDTYVYLPLN